MLHLFETHFPTDPGYMNRWALNIVTKLLSEDTLDVAHHLPRLVQLVEDALTKQEWQHKLSYWEREIILRFVREKGPAIPEMCRREALRGFMPPPQHMGTPLTQLPADMDTTHAALPLSDDTA